MPFICLANGLVPDAAVQILDLKPNTSLKNQVLESPGQTRYVNRVQNKTVVLDAAGVVQADCDGLSAYLVDKVEVGGLLQAKATIQTATLAANDTLTVSGVATLGNALSVAVFKFAAGNNDMTKAGTAADPFLVGLGANNVAATANLVAAINDAAGIARIKVATGTTKYVVASVPGGGTLVTLAFADVNGAVVGPVGSTVGLTIGGVAAHMIVNDLAGNVVTRLTRTTAGLVVCEFWTAAIQAAASAALIAKVDAGTALTLAVVNVSLLATCGAELTNAGGSASVGSISNLLSIVAGRGYRIFAHPFEAPTTANAKFTDAVTWSATLKGSFTHKVRQNVLKGKTTGGTVADIENKPIRTTYDSGALGVSIASGHLKKLTDGTMTLFPSTKTTSSAKHPQVKNARIVTVYDDDGSVLA